MSSLPRIEDLLPVLARPLQWVPHPLQQFPLSVVLEQLFRDQVAGGELDFLEGRCLALEITDACWRWPVSLAGGQLRVHERGHAADVTIRGQSRDFVLMAAGLEDPDTLFFQRRLAIEGDTELGLAVKNFLNGLDEQRLPWPAQLALQGVRALHAGLK